MNRNQRRRAEKKVSVTPSTRCSTGSSPTISASATRAARRIGRIAGTIEARDESDLLRGFIVALMNAAVSLRTTVR